MAASHRHTIETKSQQNGPIYYTDRTCMNKSEANEIASTGLRYVSKESGSPFEGMGANGEVRSCLKCGEHKLRSNGAIHRYLGGLMFFCFDCKPKRLPQ
jgi:hypothetical protein